MMTAIFVFIKCELGYANDVAADLVDNVENVSEVYSTSGQHDLLAKFQLPKDADIGTFLRNARSWAKPTSSTSSTSTIRCTIPVPLANGEKAIE